MDLYDISDAGYGPRNFHVELITPPLVAHLRGVDADLTYWSNELGGLPPAVIVRIYPRIGQSTGAVIANLVFGAVAGATGTVPGGWIHDPEVKGELGRVSIQLDGSPVTPIEFKRSLALVDGIQVPVVHLLLPQDLFRIEQGAASSVILGIEDDEGRILPWGVPDETVRQIAADFEEYRAGLPGPE